MKQLTLSCLSPFRRAAPHPIIKWISEHKYPLILALYAFVLLCVGMANSPQFRRFLRRRGIVD